MRMDHEIERHRDDAGNFRRFFGYVFGAAALGTMITYPVLVFSTGGDTKSLGLWGFAIVITLPILMVGTTMMQRSKEKVVNKALHDNKKKTRDDMWA